MHTKSVISERPLYISPLYKPPTDGRKYNFRIAVCLGVVYESPPWLNEWLRYQKAIGIDHIHMIADDTFEEAGGFKNEYLQQLIQEGFLSTDIYHAWLNSSQVYSHSQGLAYQDCVYTVFVINMTICLCWILMISLYQLFQVNPKSPTTFRSIIPTQKPTHLIGCISTLIVV